MKIVIRGAGFENKGAEAMLRVVQREIGKRIPEAGFYATVFPPQADVAYRSGIVPVFYKPNIRMEMLRLLQLVAKTRDFMLRPKYRNFTKSLKTNKKAVHEINTVGPMDAVLDISGFAYSDTMGEGSFQYAWPWLEHCYTAQKPYIFMPQAWGPFENTKIATWAKQFYQAASLIVSRDHESSKHLSKLMEIPEAEIKQVPDIAFSFQGAPAVVGNAILRNAGVQKDANVIGIAPNMRIYERTHGNGAANKYVRFLVHLANHCIEDLGSEVVLIPNEIRVSGSPRPDDRYLCGMIAAQINQYDHCFNLNGDYGAEVAKSIIGNVHFLIASRFHSLVFALSQGIPVMALGWSHKYQELLRHFGLDEYVMDYDRLESAGVFEKLDSIWHQREVFAKHIQEALPAIKTRVDHLFNDVATIILRNGDSG